MMVLAAESDCQSKKCVRLLMSLQEIETLDGENGSGEQCLPGSGTEKGDHLFRSNVWSVQTPTSSSPLSRINQINLSDDALEMPFSKQMISSHWLYSTGY